MNNNRLIRVGGKPEKGFTQVDNRLIAFGEALSLAARGIFMYLQSVADSWKPCREDIKAKVGIGEKTYRQAIIELDSKNALKVLRISGANNSYKYVLNLNFIDDCTPGTYRNLDDTSDCTPGTYRDCTFGTHLTTLNKQEKDNILLGCTFGTSRLEMTVPSVPIVEKVKKPYILVDGVSKELKKDRNGWEYYVLEEKHLNKDGVEQKAPAYHYKDTLHYLEQDLNQ